MVAVNLQCLRPGRVAWLFLLLAWLACQSAAIGSECPAEPASQSEKASSSAQSPARPKAINKSPLLDRPDGWSSGFALATGRGRGVVVGPGSTNPNVFAQHFSAKPAKQFKVVARASSVDVSEVTAAIQVNWHGRNGFLSSSLKYFKAGPTETVFHHIVIAPRGATLGILYVVPGGPRDVVRYTEMALSHLSPFDDFMTYRFLGIKGQNVLVWSAVLFLLIVFYYFYRRQLVGIGALLISGIGNPVIRHFPLLAMILCGGVFIFLEGDYEQHYDSHWHQALAESLMQWKSVSLDLGGSLMHNFGIQHPMNPQLSPTFWIGSIVSPDYRVQAQAAFQAMVLFAILVKICRAAGAGVRDASAISLIASGYLWVPYLSDHAITLNATLGLLWQEGVLATLLAFFCFARIGYGDSRITTQIWPIIGLALAVLWFFIAYPVMIAFFTLATTGLCAGAIAGVESKKELSFKVTVIVLLIAALLLLGFHNYVLNLFFYTPQLYYETLYNHDFKSLFFKNTSLLLSSSQLGGTKIVVFFILAGIGAFFALRFGNRFARHVVFGGLALEAAIHLFSGTNALLKLVPLTFTYVEKMGMATIALLAATAVWVILRIGIHVIPKCYNLLAPDGSRTCDLLSPKLRNQTAQSLPYLVLLGFVVIIFNRLSGQTGLYSGWPPRTDSIPAQVQARELAVKPGEKFKGRGAVLLGMDKKGPARWGADSDFFPVLYYKLLPGLGNDLMNDAKIAGIPMVNDYGHWISPPMLALLTAAFYRPDDFIDRGAQAPRVFRPNLARLLGVSLVVSDKALPGEIELYRGLAVDHPLFIHRIPGANLGQYSPVATVVVTNAGQILDHLQAADFDGNKLAILETPFSQNLLPAERVAVSLHKGPRIHVDAYSEGTSLLVLPFDYSHCLEVEGDGLDRVIPVNLAQTGLVVHGKISLDISYRYGLLKGTSCRKQDLERIKKLNLEEAATGRLFHDARPARSGAK